MTVILLALPVALASGLIAALILIGLLAAIARSLPGSGLVAAQASNDVDGHGDDDRRVQE